MTALGFGAGGLGILLGLGNHIDAAITVSRMVGTLLGPLLAAKLLLDSFRWRLRPMIGLGAAMGAVLVFGATVQPWYLLWAAMPLAVGGGQHPVPHGGDGHQRGVRGGAAADREHVRRPHVPAALRLHGRAAIVVAMRRCSWCASTCRPDLAERPPRMARGRGHRQRHPGSTVTARLAGLPPLLRPKCNSLRA